jgi:drug/metabolite transporter (DMT)-like permease
MSDVPDGTAPFRRVALPFLLVTLIWGSTWIVIRDQIGGTHGGVAGGGVPAAWSVSYRFFIAGAAMFAYARLQGLPLALRGRDALFAGAAGVLQFVMNFNFVYAAEAYITSGLVAVVFALLIVPNTVLGRIFVPQPISRGFLVGSGIAIGGVALLFIHELRADQAATGRVLTGIALTLVAVLSASAANVMQASARGRSLPIAVVLAWAMILGACVNALYAAATAGPPVFDPRPGYLLGLVYLALAASALAFTLYYRIIRLIGPARSAYSSVLVPIIAMALSTLFEGYRWTALAAAGGALVLIGLATALRAKAATG